MSYYLILTTILLSLTISYSESSEQEETKKDITLEFANGEKLSATDLKNEYNTQRRQLWDNPSEIAPHLYEKFLKDKKIFGDESMDKQDIFKFDTFCHEVGKSRDMLFGLISGQVCNLKKNEPLYKMQMKEMLKAHGKPLGSRGSFILPKNDKGIMETYISRIGEHRDVLDLKSVLKLPKDAPSGEGITIGLFEGGVDTSHHMVSKCFEKAGQTECKEGREQYQGHGTGVASILANIAPQSTIRFISSIFFHPKDTLKFVKEMYPNNTQLQKCVADENVSGCLNKKQQDELFSALTLKATEASTNDDTLKEVFDGIDILNVSMSFYDYNIFGEPIEDEQFKSKEEGIPAILSVLTKNKKVLVVKGAGNKGNQINKYLNDFAENDAKKRMIIVGALDYSSFNKEETIARYSYATSDTDRFICVPGEYIITAAPGGEQEHTIKGGTSATTPIVSATLALLMEKYPQWKDTPETYIDLLLESARRETLDGANEKEKKEITKRELVKKGAEEFLILQLPLNLQRNGQGRYSHRNLCEIL